MPSNRSTKRDALREQICSGVAQILKEQRLKRNLTRTEVAGQAGLNRQTIAFIETQERTPTIDTLLRVSDVLGMKLEDVIRDAREKVERSKTS